jgi:hypothetical protein
MKSIVITICLLFSIQSFGQFTTIPDVNFEQALINLGLDIGPLDGVVPTPNIDTVTSLNVNAQNINDLTGIEGFIALEYLFCRLNFLSSIDVSQNSLLLTMACGDNQLTSLDVSQNAFLHGLACDSNLLSCLNVKNGNNINFTFFYAFNNSNLQCIEVDNGSWSTTNWTPGVNFFFDAASSFSTSCGNPCSVGINENDIYNISIYPNPTSTHFTIEGLSKLYNLTIYNSLGQLLYTENNILETSKRVDVSKYSKGLLFIRIETDGEVYYHKIIKQ